MVENLPANAGNPWVRKIPWRREWQPTPVFLPGKYHGWRSVAGRSPWGLRDLATERKHKVAERLTTVIVSVIY